MTAQKDSRRTARRRLVQAAILASGWMLAVPAMAQSAGTLNWPSRPVRVVVPYPPGGVSDAVTRLVMQKLAERIGQPVVVENRPGANGMIGDRKSVV